MIAEGCETRESRQTDRQPWREVEKAGRLTHRPLTDSLDDRTGGSDDGR